MKAGDGPVQIAWMCKLAKSSAAKARTQAVNQLTVVLVSADPNPREELAGLNNAELLPAQGLPVTARTTRTAIRRCCESPASPWGY